MPVPARRLALLAVLVAALASPAAAQVVRLYEAKHRSADELLPLAETALAGGGRAAADRRSNTLVLTGSADAVETALALLATLDVRSPTVVLRYESRSARELAAEGARIAWTLDAGSVRLGNVLWPGGGTRVAVGLGAAASRRTGSFAGELRILDGQTGRIATGTSVPLTTRQVRPGPHGPQVRESTEYVTAESGFEARPRVLRDGRIELALRPFDASLRPGGAIDTSGAETVVALEPGSSFVLGGVLRGAQAQGSGVSGGGSAERHDEMLLVVRAEIE